MSASEMFYIPNTTRTPLRARLKSRQSPSAILQHAGKRLVECLIQSLATISLSYGHCPLPTEEQRRRRARERKPRPHTSCSIHSVPDRVASDHNARELRKAEMQGKPTRRRPVSAVYPSLSSNRYKHRNSMESLAELPFLQEVQAREFL